mgnify:CR=1 FL=1
MNCDKVLYFFEKINEIPRGSGNEKAVSDYIVSFAKERGLWVHQDKANNVIIKKDGSKGYENHEPVVIQGHMDMVCEKNPDVVHDFEKDPIKVIYEGDYIHADGTTLGADDGIAVAMAMALLDNENAVHPPLEVVITTDEEVGMLGAASLDATFIKGRKLLNIDSEEEGIFTVGCAGGVKTESIIPVEFTVPEYGSFVKIMVTGLEGGHSGIDIDKERGNANKIMARVLDRLKNTENIEVSYLMGGAKDNAIPRYAEMLVGCDDIDRLKAGINILAEELRAEFAVTDRYIEITAEEMEKPENVFTSESLNKVIAAIMLMPNGIQSMNLDLNMAESSNNLGVVKMNEGSVSLICAVRSSVITRKAYIKAQIEKLTKLCGGTTESHGDYPAWEYKAESPLRDLFTEVYKDCYNKTPRVETVHAGLECGLIAEKIPDMDMVSFGPNLMDIHTPKERASISSIERVWNFLCKVLEKL